MSAFSVLSAEFDVILQELRLLQRSLDERVAALVVAGVAGCMVAHAEMQPDEDRCQAMLDRMREITTKQAALIQ